MFKYTHIAITMMLTIVMVSGCLNFLEGSVVSITDHEFPPYEKPPVEQIVVADYEEFKAVLLDLIYTHEVSAQILCHNFDGEDVQSEVMRASEEIMFEHPVGAYAVADFTVTTAKVMSSFEVDIEIEFKRTAEQIGSIINASTSRYLMTQLLNIMSEHREEAAIRTSMMLSEEEIFEQIREIYYQNPRRIVMLPIVAVEIFPKEAELTVGEDDPLPSGDEFFTGDDDTFPAETAAPPVESGTIQSTWVDRIYEIKFSYVESPSILQVYRDNLALYVRQNAERALGETDAEILLSLVYNLMASTEFDEGTARTISIHGAQNFAATASGALVRGLAVGEGFAMAFKALCDELRFDCRVVLGYIDDRVHAWNIVSLDGDYYHIDVAMCVVNGLETAFLKSDTDFEELYSWDRDNTVRCEGTLTLEDIVGTEVPDDDVPDDADIPDDEIVPDDDAVPDDIPVVDD